MTRGQGDEEMVIPGGDRVSGALSGNLTAGIVRILNPYGTTAGTGFVADDGLIATCSHVVQSQESRWRGEPRPDYVDLVFRATGDRRRAMVEPEWWRVADAEDVAILRLKGPLPEGVTPLLLGSSGGTSGHPFKTFGFPAAKSVEGMYDYGTIGDATTEAGHPVLQLTGATEVRPGFSGAPVWDERASRVVGMVISFIHPGEFGKPSEATFIIPMDTLRAVCPTLRVSDKHEKSGTTTSAMSLTTPPVLICRCRRSEGKPSE